MSATTAPASAPEETVREEIEQEGIEQRGTEGTKASGQRELADGVDSPSTVEIESDAIGRLTPPARLEEAKRQQLAERVRQSERLPAGLRARIAELLEAAGTPEGFEAAVRGVEDALPGGLRIASQELRRPEHPLGSAFFSGGKPGELSDDEAERIAKEQLARAGLLRGQRVRVGD